MATIKQINANRKNALLSKGPKSDLGKLKSSKVVERKVVKRVDEFMRSPQIVITNVGMQER